MKHPDAYQIAWSLLAFALVILGAWVVLEVKEWRRASRVRRITGSPR